MTNSNENGLTSPQSQPVQITYANDFTKVPDWLQSPADGLLRLACGDGNQMGQVTSWTTNWCEFSQSLSSPEIGSKSGAYWCAADYGDSTDRKKGNVQSVSLIVLDVEKKTEQPPPLADALALCEARGWQAFGHTTYTHSPDAPRYRLCMLPSRNIKPDELRHLVHAVAKELGIERACDLPASGDPARLYYSPRVANEVDKVTFEHGKSEGSAINVDEMLSLSRYAAARPAPSSMPAQAKYNGQCSDDLRSALEYLDPDTYDSWLAGLMALKSAPISDAQELAHWWSSKSVKYSYEECQAKWESLEPTQTSYKAIFSRAQGLGWVNPQKSLFGLDEVDQETGEISPKLKRVSVGDVMSNPSPPPKFVWADYIPCGVVTYLGAHGGTGKSTMALMLTVSAALGRPLFGVDTVQCKTLFVSLEDPAHIVRHRLAGICRHWGIDPVALDGKLHIVDGTENPELFFADNRGAGETTATHWELRNLVQSEGVGLVVVDNASDAYGGDEINRRQVRAFMRALVGLARLTDCAVMLLAHVDKTTSRTRKAEGGEGYSGSTAWHNSARSRLFMTRNDDGTLSLVHQKSNLGQMCEPITLEWPDHGLPQLVKPSDIGGLLHSIASAAQVKKTKALLLMLAEFEDRQDYCSPLATARNNVHTTLSSEPDFKNLKLNKPDCRHILNQCERYKWLEKVEYQDAYRKPRQRWTVTGSGRAFAGVTAHSAPCAPSRGDAEQGAEHAVGAPCAPSCVGGVGE